MNVYTVILVYYLRICCVEGRIIILYENIVIHNRMQTIQIKKVFDQGEIT
jgi:hypothetical protein